MQVASTWNLTLGILLGLACKPGFKPLLLSAWRDSVLEVLFFPVKLSNSISWWSWSSRANGRGQSRRVVTRPFTSAVSFPRLSAILCHVLWDDPVILCCRAPVFKSCGKEVEAEGCAHALSTLQMCCPRDLTSSIPSWNVLYIPLNPYIKHQCQKTCVCCQ